MYFSFPPNWLIMGRSRNWADPRSVSDIKKIRDAQGTRRKSWKFQIFISITVIITRLQSFFFRGGVTWPDPVTSPEVTWTQNFQESCGTDVRTAMLKTAMLRADVLVLPQKPHPRGSPPPPTLESDMLGASDHKGQNNYLPWFLWQFKAS